MQIQIIYTEMVGKQPFYVFSMQFEFATIYFKEFDFKRFV